MDWKTGRTYTLSLIAVIVVGVGVMFWLALFAGKIKPPADAPPGWDTLSACASLESLDGKLTLQLGDDGTATLSSSEDKDAEPDDSEGRWSVVDEPKSLYAIDVAGKSTTYTLVKSPNGEGCMLAFGAAQATNLAQSWFSVSDDSDD